MARSEQKTESVWVFTHSEAGGHATNEDAFDVRQHPEFSPHLAFGHPRRGRDLRLLPRGEKGGPCWVGALADGQGGRSGGAAAAQLACRIVIDAALAQPIASLSKPQTWIDALRRADEGVLADSVAGYTTLIGFAVVGGRVVGASSGDSALWVAGADGRATELTARQAKNPPIGSGSVLPMSFAAELSDSWVVLAVSDGVWKYVGRDGIQAVLRENRGQVLLDALLARARVPRSGGLQDDFTAIVLQAVV
jgi:PPM family protein phosphatase